MGQRNRVLLFPFPRRQDKSVTFLYMCFDSSGCFYCLLIQFRRQTCSSYPLSHANTGHQCECNIPLRRLRQTSKVKEDKSEVGQHHRWYFFIKPIVIVSLSFPLNPLGADWNCHKKYAAMTDSVISPLLSPSQVTGSQQGRKIFYENILKKLNMKMVVRWLVCKEL